MGARGLLVKELDLKQIRELFDEAESALKFIERYHDEGLIAPSVNELRYAGYHVLRACTSDDDDDRNDQLARAAKHCKRATYDAFEVGILNHLENIALFEKDYRLAPIVPVVPNYLDLRRKAKAAKDFINDSNRDNRDQHYARCRTHLESLQDICATLDEARIELNKTLATRRKQAIATALAILVSLAGVIVALI